MQGIRPRSASGPGRRAFCQRMALALAGGLVARPALAAAPRLKIGVTGLIWGATPRTPENLEPALADMSSLGYHCFETWGSVMQALDAKGTSPILAKYPSFRRVHGRDVPIRPAQRRSRGDRVAR